MEGIDGDGVRTVPLSVKGTVKVIQLVGQMRVVGRLGGSGFEVCVLSEPLPDRCRVSG